MVVKALLSYVQRGALWCLDVFDLRREISETCTLSQFLTERMNENSG